MKGILIIPIGKIDADILKGITAALSETYHTKVEAVGGIPIPENAYRLRRKQYESTVILKELQYLKQEGLLLLGVTEVDLYAEGLNFVFGEADVFSGITVISLARLRQEFYGSPPNRKLFVERAVKEAIHEIGHACGLDHCENPKCIMYFSNNIRDTDRKGPGFCSVCKSTIGIGP